MAKEKDIKTNAMRFLETKKVLYKAYTYECDEFTDGMETVRKLGVDAEKTFKTLVARGKSESCYVFVIPVAEELDLKKAAKTVSEKSVELIPLKDLTAVTGYVRGGCSPVGMKKQFKTVIHDSAKEFDTIYVSGGKIGLQLEFSPTDLAKVINACFEHIIF